MSKIMLKSVRLSFPNLYKKSSFNGKEGKYEATLLLSKNDGDAYDMINKAIDEALAEAKIKVPAANRFLKDGDDSEYDGYPDHWSIKASNSSRPTLVDKNAIQSTPEDELFYPGCYVNAQIGVWVQNNSYGKRVNANLYGVQFVKDGVDLAGGAKVASVDDFAAVSPDVDMD